MPSSLLPRPLKKSAARTVRLEAVKNLGFWPVASFELRVPSSDIAHPYDCSVSWKRTFVLVVAAVFEANGVVITELFSWQ
jgi:hypothetical protein